MKYSLLTLMLIFSSAAFSQNATVTGKIQSNDGRNLVDAKIYAVGHSDTSFTDMDGRYVLSLPEGTYIVQFEAEEFEIVADTHTLKSGGDYYINKTLFPIQIKQTGTAEIRVKRKAADNSVKGAIQTKQLSSQVVEAVSAEDFKKTTIRTTSDAIKRIPGATIMEGKFANIRGMFDRYNAGYLNGAPLPSTESDRKAFSFDVIPANLLDNIVVIKSGTPDLIGDFGGGIIRINTKSIPLKTTQSLSIGFQYNSITSFRPVQSFKTSGSEYFGIAGSDRSIPNLEGNLNKVDPNHNAAESKKFSNDWTVNTIKPMPTPRFSYTLGIPFKLKNKQEIGLLVSLNYSTTQKYSDGIVNRNDLSDNRMISAFKDQLFTTNVQNGGVMNLSYKINNRHRIDWKNLYTLNYDAASTLRRGISDFDNEITSDGYSNLVNANRLASTQVNGIHVIGKRQVALNWLVNYGNTKREIPDFRIAQYASFSPTERYLVTNDFFNAGSGRFFSALDENTISASADLKHTFKTGLLTTNLKYGVFKQHRERNFNSRRFVYGPVGKVIASQDKPETDLAQDRISSDGIFLVEKTKLDLDQYKGSSDLNAGFVMLENSYPLFKTGRKENLIKVIYGVRFEQFSQIITNDIFTRIYQKDVSNTGTTNDFLPSINVITPLTSKSGFRMAYYKTVNRPEMRELAPFSFYNFNLNSEVIGNTNLKRAILHNYDLRYEIYPGKEDMFSIGLFAKEIINPIEFSLDPTQPQIRTFTYKNEKSASIQGLELELRKNMAFAGKAFLPGFFKYLNAYCNFSIINSVVKFKEGSTGVTNRPLQGQSPYVFNASLFYDNDVKGWNASVNFNKLGSRIAYIGVPENLQPFGMDIYEFGRGVFDMQLGKNIGKAGNLKVTVGDILAQKTAFYQDLNRNGKYESDKDNTLFSFTNGRTVTLSYSITF